MNNKVVNKLNNSQSLALEDIKFVLNYIKNIVNDKVIKDDNKTCFESNRAIMAICDSIGAAYYPASTNELNMMDLLHYFGFIGFNTENGPLWTLIDLTYNQFSDKTYPIYIDSKYCDIKSPGNYISEINKNNLISNGYIVLTKENYTDYINSFIESFSTVKSINKEEVLEKAFNILDDNGIKFKEESKKR